MRKGGHYGLGEQLIPLTAPEVRRLIALLVWMDNQWPVSFCPVHDEDGVTKPEPANVISKIAHQICDCSTSQR